MRRLRNGKEMWRQPATHEGQKLPAQRWSVKKLVSGSDEAAIKGDTWQRAV